MPRNSKKTKTNSNMTLIVVSFILLFLSYAINFFGLWNYFYSFQKDSESLVVNELQCRNIHNQDLFGGMLVIVRRDIDLKTVYQGYNSCSTKTFEPYLPQFNLQGHLIAPFAPHANTQIKHYLVFIKAILISLTAALMTAFILKVRKEFSLIVSLVVLAGLVVSDWMVFMARNLYWVPVLIFLPFVFSFLFYKDFKDKKHLNWFYLLGGFLIFLKALTGYEFLTCILLSSFVPVLYYEIRYSSKINLQKLAVIFTKVFVTGVVGFLLAFSFNLAQLATQYHSLPKAFSLLKERSVERTVGTNNDSFFGTLIPEAGVSSSPTYQFVNSLFYTPGLKPNTLLYDINAFSFQVAVYLVMGMFTFPVVIASPFSIILQSFGFSVLVSLITIWVWRKKGILQLSKKHKALGACIIFAFFSSTSWFIFAHPHITHHPHLDGIVFYIPYALIFYILVGTLLEDLLIKWKIVSS